MRELNQWERNLLVEEFGSMNVENALAFIAEQRNRSNLMVKIKPTASMVRDILEAAHGRLPVGSIVGICSDKEPFYHHPDRCNKKGWSPHKKESEDVGE